MRGNLTALRRLSLLKFRGSGAALGSLAALPVLERFDLAAAGGCSLRGLAAATRLTWLALPAFGMQPEDGGKTVRGFQGFFRLQLCFR